MDCSFPACHSNQPTHITCEICFLPKYCSLRCKCSHAELHSKSCQAPSYSLKDFTSVKDSQKLTTTGSYGEMQLVQKSGSSSLFVLKIYKKSHASSIIPLKVLFREIGIHKTLIHPNILRLYDQLEDRMKIYLVLEHADKGSLFEMIKKKIKLSEKDAWSIFTQTCVGLSYLHKKEVLHRGLKPENLLISKEDVVKICEFGWSAQSNEDRMTFCGTLDYMSPEILNNQPQSFKVDIWALGVLLYEMLHGAPPFRAKNPREMSRIISENRFILGQHVSESAKSLISSILRENPEDRPDMLTILRSDWIRELGETKLKQNYKLIHPVLGEGIILHVVGLVCTIVFTHGQAELLEPDILRECSIFSEVGEPLYERLAFIQVPTTINNEGSRISPLYKKLGINTSSAKCLKSAIKSTDARSKSKNASSPSGKGRLRVTFEPGVVDHHLPRSPKFIEEAKKCERMPGKMLSRTESQLDKPQVKKLSKQESDAIDNKIAKEVEEKKSVVEPKHKVEQRGGTPKSRFLMNFKKSD